MKRTELIGSSNPIKNATCIKRNLEEKDEKLYRQTASLMRHRGKYLESRQFANKFFDSLVNNWQYNSNGRKREINA